MTGTNLKRKQFWHTAIIFDNVLDYDWNKLKAETISAYGDYFHRVGIHLPENSNTSHLTTDKRIESFQSYDDPSLAALYYNYGRYLLISSRMEIIIQILMSR